MNLSPLDLASSGDPVAALRDAAATGRVLSLATSGTGAAPRRVLRTAASWVDSFAHVSELAGIDASSRVWVPGPLESTMNLFAVCHAGWVGANVADRSGGHTHAHVTPSRLAALVAQTPEQVAGVHVIVAGDRLSRPAHAAATAAGATVSHYYGAAELSFVAWGRHAEDLRPFPGVEVQIREGRVWVRSPYLSEPSGADTAQRDTDGWASVADRGQFDAAGRLIVTGRDGAITTGGATVQVADIEATLRPGLRGDVAVLGLDHPDLGQLVAAVLSEPDDLATARAATVGLTVAQRPRRWFVSPLPLTNAGKVDRRALIERIESGQTTDVRCG